MSVLESVFQEMPSHERLCLLNKKLDALNVLIALTPTGENRNWLCDELILAHAHILDIESSPNSPTEGSVLQ